MRCLDEAGKAAVHGACGLKKAEGIAGARIRS